MKFGEALPQRSVQEWLPCKYLSLSLYDCNRLCSWNASFTDIIVGTSSDNLDYNEIKQLIKRYTTGKPLVKSPEAKTDFEDEFFNILIDQLGRVLLAIAFGNRCELLTVPQIDLFVKSKSGEVDRRIGKHTRYLISRRKLCIDPPYSSMQTTSCGSPKTRHRRHSPTSYPTARSLD